MVKDTIRRIEQSVGVRSVRSGLVNIIPVLIIGAFSLILKTLPLNWYQNIVLNACGGFLLTLFETVYAATFGVLSVYMTLSISRSYMKIKADADVVGFGASIAAIISFFILAGAYLPGFGTENTGPKAMFLAIITGLGSSALYFRLYRFLYREQQRLFSSGANREFNIMVSTLTPVAVTVVLVAVLNYSVIWLFHVDSFHTLVANLFNKLFSFGKVGFFKGFFFVLLSSSLWMLGIHGSDTLEGVMQTYFAPGLAANQAAAASGAMPPAVLTKEFFDCFVLMGGCGSTICLLIALLIFSRNRASRGLAATAAFPMLFNINELMVFGLPVIFNPVMLIPFLAVPLTCYSTSYLAIYSGAVPHITSEVAWTTPILLGGLRATGSVSGALLQAFNVGIGALIYMPFVKLLDKRMEEESKRGFASFVEFFQKNEALLGNQKLTDLNDTNGEFAKGLSAEIQYAVERGQVTLAYQPQYNYDGRCIGVEALLRWQHPNHGYIYPPLVIKLAQDGGFLPELEEIIIKRVMEDYPKVIRKFGRGIKVSFNVTGQTVVTERFLNQLRMINGRDPFMGKNLCVEVTEQTALMFDDRTQAAFEEMHNMGLILAIDDFSMGQTSLDYLKDNMFDIIKLDGSLIKGLYVHDNCREIISSIVQLSSTLNLTVIAEFVETEQDRETLHELGCDNYQGYLYSPAQFLED